MKGLLLRIASLAAITAAIFDLLWTPFRGGYRPPVRWEDFIFSIAIQACVPLFLWIILWAWSVSRGMQAVVTLFWTWLASWSLAFLAEKFHNSSVHQPPHPWDYLFYEGGIIMYLVLVSPTLSIIAAGLSLIPFARTSTK